MIRLEKYPDVGEGHIFLMPLKWNILNGTWAMQVNTSQAFNFNYYNSSNADNNSISTTLYLARGTYTIQLLTGTSTDRAIIDIDIDGVEVASTDLYSAGTVYNVIREAVDIPVLTSGLKTLTYRIDGKNGASSAYYGSFSALIFIRTA